ncbi:ATP-grasp domain-containing protein [Solemya velum gill symbiont]|uniref:ATP-grasp domain-containing protein n=1 Tax=Solemya velum gill symbiont TaxID=2340 RepID=UPI000997B64D|nr:hypothetical protein [Solemya velum gill symbiont]OOZ10802.1 hypothetical protein BOW25_12895 [Solemya velum gill symbiont]
MKTTATLGQKKTHHLIKPSSLPSPSLSIKTGSSKQQAVNSRKPVMLHIKAIPDNHQISVDNYDHALGGFNYSYNGNLHLLENERMDEYEHQTMILGGSRPKRIDTPGVDFAFNFICDPDISRKSLEYAIQFVDENSIPTLNHPAKVLRLTRDGLFRHFSDINGLKIPKTLSISPHSLKEVQNLVESGEIALPLIIRPAGKHGGQGMYLLESLDDIRELERFAFDGRNYYLIEFHDYRSADGFYRKYRILWIDGKIYPRHLIIDKEWNLHAANKNNFMRDTETFIQEETDFLVNCEEVLGNDGMRNIQTLFSGTGLDYCGMDFSLMPDNRVFVFEANAAMNTTYNRAHAASSHLDSYLIMHEQAKIKMLSQFANTAVAETDKRSH